MTTLQVKVSATAEDGTERVGTDFITNFVATGRGATVEYNAFFRFLNVTVPQGANVSSATLTLNIVSIAGTPNTTLYGVDVDDAAAFATPGNLPSAATRTTASADPDPAATGTKVITITSIVQEIVDRAGWASGNDMAFVGDDNAGSGPNYWEAEDYQAAGTAEAILDITYTTSVSVTPATLALTLSAFAPTIAVSNNQSVTPSTASLTVSFFAPTVTLGVGVVPGAGSLTLATFAPTIIIPQTFTPGTAALVTATFAPAANAGVRVTPETLAVLLQAFAPVISLSGHITLTPETLSLVLASFAPTPTLTVPPSWPLTQRGVGRYHATPVSGLGRIISS